MSAKILIIDDEKLFCEDLGTLLSRKGYTCKTAADGKQGVDVLDEFCPDVVLCDIVMPGCGGIELLPDILRHCPECLVIMITAYFVWKMYSLLGSVSDKVTSIREAISEMFKATESLKFWE